MQPLFATCGNLLAIRPPSWLGRIDSGERRRHQHADRVGSSPPRGLSKTLPPEVFVEEVSLPLQPQATKRHNEVKVQHAFSETSLDLFVSPACVVEIHKRIEGSAGRAPHEPVRVLLLDDTSGPICDQKPGRIPKFRLTA